MLTSITTNEPNQPKPPKPPKLTSNPQTSPSSRAKERSPLPRLRKNHLPNLQPLLLLVGQRPMRVLKCGTEEVAQTAAEEFQRQHGFPVSDSEADAVVVY